MRKHSTTGPPGLDRLLPHDKDAERAVVGQAILAGEIPAEAQGLQASDFYVIRHSQIWAAMRRLEADGIAIDLVSTKDALPKSDDNDSPDRVAAELAAILDGHWKSANLSHYVELIRTKAAHRAAIVASSEITEMAFSGASSAEDLLAAAEKQAEMLREHCAGQEHRGFRLRLWDLSKAAMEQEAQVDWLIERIMAQPDVVNVVGDGGVGKSKSAAALALSVAFGKPLWGHFEVRRSGRVVYLNEERPDLTIRHLRTLAPSMGIDPDEIEKRIILTGRGRKTWRVTDPAAFQSLVRFIEQLGDVVLIIWDSLHVLHDKDENDNAQMTQVIERFRSICMQTSTCGVLLHHTGKFDFGDAGLSARGATAIKDTVDAQFVLRRPDREKQDEVRVAQDKTRRAVVPPFMLKLEHDEGGDVLGVRWIGKAPTKAEQALPAVLDVISSAPPPLKSGEIALKLAKQFRKDDVYEALAKVRNEDLAPWRGDGTRGFVYGAEAEPDGA